MKTTRHLFRITSPLLALGLFVAGCDRDESGAEEGADAARAADADNAASQASELAAPQGQAAVAGPSCQSICERGVRECTPAYPRDTESELSKRVDECQKSCESNNLTDADLRCWSTAPCGAFLGRTTSMKAGVCQTQLAYDNKGKNNAKLVDELRGKLHDATVACETAKEGGVEPANEQKERGKKPAAAKAEAAPPVDPKAQHFKMASAVSSQLYTPFLTSSCKEALSAAAHKAHTQCLNNEEDDVAWIEEAGEDACK